MMKNLATLANSTSTDQDSVAAKKVSLELNWRGCGWPSTIQMNTCLFQVMTRRKLVLLVQIILIRNRLPIEANEKHLSRVLTGRTGLAPIAQLK